MKSPIKKYEMDKKASWEVRYKKLEKHHREETQWLIDQVKKLEEELSLQKRLNAFSSTGYRGTSKYSDLKIC